MKDYSAQKIFEKIVQFADIGKKDILEIGCGDGRITTLLAGKPEKLVAIDPDAEKINEAKNAVGGVRFQIASGEKMDFSANCFDLVIFTLSLHHQDSKKAIEEAIRVVKEKGTILVIEPLAEGEVEQIFAMVHNEDEEKVKAQQAIIDSGLVLEKSETFSAKWVFKDREDLVRSTFEYYEKAFDEKIADEMSDLLGEKVNHHPIVLFDRMIIQSLKKAA